MNKLLIGLSGCLAFASCSLNKQEKERHERPNIILIMADDVAPEHFSCYGGDIPTPNIDKLASEGMMFHRAYAPSAACTPSRFSIMTGLYAGRCQADTFVNSIPVNGPYKIAWNTPIVEENTSIHDLMTKAGYFTGYVGKFHIGDLSFNESENNPDIPEIDPDLDPEDPGTRGLLEIHQKFISERVMELTACSYTAAIQWENPEQLPIKAVQKHNLEWLTSGAADFLENRQKNTPFFLHFNTTALHGPNHFYDLHAPAKYTPEGILEEPYKYHPPRHTIFERMVEMGMDTGKNVPDHIKHYNAGILYFDDQVGAIMNMIEKQGLKENTLIILTADHAIEPGKSTCYERGSRIPFIVSWPSEIKANSHSMELVQFTDFLPTFAEIAKAKNDKKTDGVSFLPAMMNDTLERDYIFSEEGYTRSVTGKKYKYISMRFPDDVIQRIESGEAEIITHFGDQFQAHGLIASKYYPGYFDADQLYDLEKDPWEQNNLAYDEDYKDTLKKMKTTLSGFTNSFEHNFPLDNVSFMDSEAYWKLVKETKAMGTDAIYWWKRELKYPPDVNVDYFKNKN